MHLSLGLELLQDEPEISFVSSLIQLDAADSQGLGDL